MLATVLLWKNGALGFANNSEITSIAEPTNSTKADELSEKDDKTQATSKESNNKQDKKQSVGSKEKDGASEVSKTDTKKDIYGYLKNFVIQNGTINGDYCYYSKTADNYGGYDSEDFSLYYWGDTDKIEFCLHSVLDDTFSINFYLYVPKNHTGSYEYISSYYYRDSGEALYEAEGTIEADKFTKNYPLTCTKYTGSTDKQNEFMEMSRQGICDLLDCLKEFVVVEKLEYSFFDLGFTEF